MFSPTQFNGACVAGAIDDTLCVWRTRDGKAVTEKFSELITALQWKPTQKEGKLFTVIQSHCSLSMIPTRSRFIT